MMLAGCASSPPAVETRTVEVPVPVVKPLPAELTRDCAPRYLYPAGDLTVRAIVDRLEAVEIAIAICRNQLELIRAEQP